MRCFFLLWRHMNDGTVAWAGKISWLLQLLLQTAGNQVKVLNSWEFERISDLKCNILAYVARFGESNVFKLSTNRISRTIQRLADHPGRGRLDMNLSIKKKEGENK